MLAGGIGATSSWTRAIARCYTDSLGVVMDGW
jgi:hypothetical protein